MSNTEKPRPVLDVKVSSENQLLVRAGAAVIADALTNSGFKHVVAGSLIDIRTQAGRDAFHSSQRDYLASPETLLKQVRQEDPELLDAPVLVQYFATEESEQPERDHITERDLQVPDAAERAVLGVEEVASGVLGTAVLEESLGGDASELTPSQDDAIERDLEAGL